MRTISMRLALPSTSFPQSRFRWTAFTSPKTQWNIGSATLCCFMSSSPVDTHGDLSGLNPERHEVVDATTPNKNPSSMSSPIVHKDDTGEFLRKFDKFIAAVAPDEIKSLAMTTKGDDSGVEQPQYSLLKTAKDVVSGVKQSLYSPVKTAKDDVSRVEKPQYSLWKEVTVRHPFQKVKRELGSVMKSGEPASSNSLSVIPTEQSKYNLLLALRRGDRHELLLWLLETVENPAFIKSLPDTAVLQMLRLLDPQEFIEPYRRLYRYAPPEVHQFIFGSSKGTGILMADHMSVYNYIVQNVIAHRRDMSFQMYEVLLMLARATGYGALVTRVWHDMLESKHKPDVKCYNYYLEALCWPHDYYPARPDYMIFGDRSGVKSVVSRVYTDMIEEGVMADATTFCHLMTAYSREGDLESVKIILKSVWHVDVDAIMETNDDDLRSLNDVPPDSPLFPTPDLLFTIAHVFGSRNHLAVGLRVVDCISRRYAVPIGDQTWNELAKWTFIIARRSRKDVSNTYEKIPLWSLEVLWKAMTAVTTPDMSESVFHLVWKMYHNCLKTHASLSLLITGLLNHRRSEANYHQSSDELEHHSHEGVNTYGSSHLRHKVSLAATKAYREYRTVSWCFRTLLRSEEWGGSATDRVVVWQRQMLPEVVHLFWEYRPRPGWADYKMDTGKVRLANWTMHGIGRRDFDLNEYLGTRIDALPDIDDQSAALKRTEPDSTF